MTEPITLTLLATGGLVALALVAYGLGQWRLAYRLYRERPNAVLDTPGGGTVELSGTVVPGAETLESPFTDTECVALEYVVEERRSRGLGTDDSRTRWVEPDSTSDRVPFSLEDDSGAVLVDPTGADRRLDVGGPVHLFRTARRSRVSPDRSRP